MSAPDFARDFAEIAPDLWHSARAAARFVREARAASAIVHLYDVATEPTAFIAMELVEGETLRRDVRAVA